MTAAGLVAAILMGAACAGSDPPEDERLSLEDVAGTYAATIPERDFRRFPFMRDLDFGGDFELMLGRGGSYEIHSDETGQVASGDLALMGEDRLEFDEPPAPEGAFNCLVDGKRTEDGRSLYSFTLEAETLTLALEREPCPLRGEILERAWSRD